MTTDPLVQAAAEALDGMTDLDIDLRERGEVEAVLAIAVAAVVPLLRAQIAAEIRAERDGLLRAQFAISGGHTSRDVYLAGMTSAAKTAEGTA